MKKNMKDPRGAVYCRKEEEKDAKFDNFEKTFEGNTGIKKRRRKIFSEKIR